MKSYKLNNEDSKKTPSKETIEKYKDFSHLSHEYNRMTNRPTVPLYKDKRAFLVILIIALLAFILSQVDLSEEKESAEPSNGSDTTEQIVD